MGIGDADTSIRSPVNLFLATQKYLKQNKASRALFLWRYDQNWSLQRPN